MAPDAEDCETPRHDVEEQIHQGRRILPEERPPAQAWTENEDERPGVTNSPGENRRLLPTGPPLKQISKLQAGVTLAVLPPGKYTKCPQFKRPKVKRKTKFQKNKDKLIALLKPPYFILTMIIIIVSIQLWGSKDFRAYLEWSPVEWWLEPWRLFTYGCVHAGAVHLALNALVALAVGWPLEREQGWWRVAVLWFGGVVAGALGAGALQPHVHVVGASAAVYALLTAHISNVCLRFGHIPMWWFRPLSVLVLVTSEGCWALAGAPSTWSSSQTSSYEYVAWSAHTLGAAVGIPLAFIVFTGENRSKRYVTVCRVISGVLLINGVVLSIFYYVCWCEADHT